MSEKRKAAEFWRRLKAGETRRTDDDTEELHRLWHQLGRITPPQVQKDAPPGELLRAIATEKRAAAPLPKKKHLLILRPAAGFLILAVGIALGYMAALRNDTPRMTRMADEVRQVRRMMMFSLLNKESPIERLRAVRYLHNEAASDDRATAELLKVLDTDPSVAVRMESLYALSTIAPKRPDLRRELTRSLGHQESALLQLSLVELLAKSPNPDAVNAFRALLERPDLSMPVRLRIERELNADAYQPGREKI